jgi:hypothetical protein
MLHRGDDNRVRLAQDPATQSNELDAPMSSTEIRVRLMELARERLEAEYQGLGANGTYMADLEEEIRAYRAALVGARVTDVAVLHGMLHGRNLG